MREPMLRSDSVTTLTRSGSVVPIRKQGIARIAKDKTKRARVLTKSECGDRAGSAGTRNLIQSSIGGIARAQSATAA
jgi:hypothetical protein